MKTSKKINLYKILFVSLIIYNANAQTNNLYGIVRENYYTTITDPIDPSITIQQFDYSTIRLGNTNPTIGLINNSGTNAYTQNLNLTGSALNPVRSTYIIIGTTDVISLDLITGNVVNQVPLNNPIATSYFDNFRFNNSDATVYGLARRNSFDPITSQTTGEIYLAKLDEITGLITQISANSVASQYALSGSAIDPFQMVYYFSTGNNLMGLDIYNGSVFSNVPITIAGGGSFENFTYSCADNSLYGLITQNTTSETFPFQTTTTLKLGKINPTTGIVTAISDTLYSFGYSLNAGATVDPNTLTYYFSTGNNIIGVSLFTGLVTSNVANSFQDGDYFDLMRSVNNCISATALRANPSLEAEDFSNIKVSIYPNPTSEKISIVSNQLIKSISIYTIEGKLISEKTTNSNQDKIDMTSYNDGIYIIRITDENNLITSKKIIKK